MGYCLLGYGLSDDKVDPNTTWQFEYLGEGWRDLNFGEMVTNFAFWEANGVCEPSKGGLLFRFSLDVSHVACLCGNINRDSALIECEPIGIAISTKAGFWKKIVFLYCVEIKAFNLSIK